MNDKLEALRREQEEAALVEKEKLMATRYRKIKFFERQKLQRSLSHNSRALEQAASQSEREQLQTERRQLLQDLQYVLYYPRDVKYKSVLKNPRHVIDEWRAQPDFDKKVEDEKKKDGNVFTCLTGWWTPVSQRYKVNPHATMKRNESLATKAAHKKEEQKSRASS